MAGASSPLESSDDDSFRFGVFFAGITFFTGVFDGGSSSLEESSDEDSFGLGAAFLGVGFGAALAGAFFSDSSSLDESSLEDSAFFRMD